MAPDVIIVIALVNSCLSIGLAWIFNGRPLALLFKGPGGRLALPLRVAMGGADRLLFHGPHERWSAVSHSRLVLGRV
ncbi:hypothetical protein EVAR_5017_1 [Eumeta japonica]|uniref:Uncharacterized protein n=1 Tax=Eumeta variegata TaxID=151549 RepID=A0A4C1SU23_EUMVA|nr:hypothetical protein EVAR_5017_1 [Eumeta japonica]